MSGDSRPFLGDFTSWTFLRMAHTCLETAGISMVTWPHEHSQELPYRSGDSRPFHGDFTSWTFSRMANTCLETAALSLVTSPHEHSQEWPIQVWRRQAFLWWLHLMNILKNDPYMSGDGRPFLGDFTSWTFSSIAHSGLETADLSWICTGQSWEYSREEVTV